MTGDGWNYYYHHQHNLLGYADPTSFCAPLFPLRLIFSRLHRDDESPRVKMEGTFPQMGPGILCFRRNGKKCEKSYEKMLDVTIRYEPRSKLRELARRLRFSESLKTHFPLSRAIFERSGGGREKKSCTRFRNLPPRSPPVPRLHLRGNGGKNAVVSEINRFFNVTLRPSFSPPQNNLFHLRWELVGIPSSPFS